MNLKQAQDAMLPLQQLRQNNGQNLRMVSVSATGTTMLGSTATATATATSDDTDDDGWTLLVTDEGDDGGDDDDDNGDSEVSSSSSSSDLSVTDGEDGGGEAAEAEAAGAAAEAVVAVIIPFALTRTFRHPTYLDGSKFVHEVIGPVCEMNQHYAYEVKLHRVHCQKTKTWQVVTEIKLRTVVLGGLSSHDFMVASLIDIELERPNNSRLVLLPS